MTTINEEIVADADDGFTQAKTRDGTTGPETEQFLTGTNSSYNYIHAGYYKFSGTTATYSNHFWVKARRWAGTRFRTIAIPQGATISGATLTLKSYGPWAEAEQFLDQAGKDVTVFADAVDDAPAWGTSSRIKDITKTTASAVLSAAGKFTTPVTGTAAMTSVVQELVDRVGWASNNNIRFMMSIAVPTTFFNETTHTGTDILSVGKSNGFEAIEGTGTAHATLDITYTTGNIQSGDGSATGTSTAAAVPEVAGLSAGTSTAAAVAVAAGSAAGTSTAAAVPEVFGTAAGTSTVISNNFLKVGAGSSAGTSTAAGAGILKLVADGISAGTSTATAVSVSKTVTAGASAGTSTATAVGVNLGVGAGASAGVATASGVPEVVGVSAGTSTAAAEGKFKLSVPGLAEGNAYVNAIGESVRAAAGSSAGTSTSIGIAPSVNTVIVGAAAGTSAVAGVGAFTTVWDNCIADLASLDAEIDCLDIIVRDIEETMVPATQGEEYRSKRPDL
jgi:hypothetical protein